MRRRPASRRRRRAARCGARSTYLFRCCSGPWPLLDLIRMRPTRRLLASFVLAACGFVVAGCQSDSPLAPSSLQVVRQPGVFELVGYVDDTSFRALSGATVEVLDGPQTGISTMTDSNGHFSLTGVFTEATRLRATEDGYQAAIQTLQSMPMTFFLVSPGHPETARRSPSRPIPRAPSFHAKRERAPTRQRLPSRRRLRSKSTRHLRPC